MEEFKIALFENEFKIKFPVYRVLSQPECRELITSLSKKFGIDSSNIDRELSSLEYTYQQYNALENFKLIDTLKKLNVNPKLDILVNWYRFENVDVFKISDLDKYFYDIWFPSSDDIDILDETLNWVLTIRHDGIVSFLFIDESFKE